MPKSARAHPVAIVTGGAKGIGRAIVDHLVRNNWHVCVVDIEGSGARRAFAKHRSIAVVEGDVGQEDTAKRAVAEALEQFDRLDAVVSNAGVMIRKPLKNLSLEEWHKVIDTNLTATFLFARAAEKALRRSKGAIVTIASTRALMSERDTESYSATKGGLVALTHALAISLGPDVRVNCVSPGWIHTTIETGGKLSALRKKDHAQHPVGRVGEAKDVAELVAFLLDRERSGFITGANFVVDGGMTRKMIYEE